MYKTAFGEEQRDKLAAEGWTVYSWLRGFNSGFVYLMEREVDR